jgi:quinol monooxygenase YgiN
MESIVIRHIVAFRLEAESAVARAEHAMAMAAALEPLNALDEVLSLTVRPDLGLVDGHWHVVLVSEHPDSAALEAYQAHPAHRAASAEAGRYVAERAVVDYEVTAG